MKTTSRSGKALLWLAMIVVLAQASGAYSVLTHEQVADLLWEDRIQPMLKRCVPDLTAKQLSRLRKKSFLSKNRYRSG